MKKIGIYWKVYIVLVLLLIAGGIALCIYTKNSLDIYEKSQPEKIARQEMVKIQNAAKYKTLDVIMDISKYDKEVVDKYYEMMSKAKSWDCKMISGGYSDTAQSWGVYADDQLVAKVNLSGSNTRTMLLILTASDWTVGSLVSGLDLMPSPTPGPTGEPIIITKYEYALTLPKSYTVVCEGKEVAGTPKDDKLSYSFVTTEDTIIIKDAYGAEVAYKHGSSLSGHNIVVKVPDVYTLSLKGVDTAAYVLPEKEDIKSLYVSYSFASGLPHVNVYHFDDALTHPDFVITDRDGNPVPYAYEGDSIIMNDLVKGGDVPAEISDVTDVMAIAEKWSLLLTRDLGNSSENYGLTKMKKYIIKNSPLISIAQGFINNDMWTVSNHSLGDPTFSDERVSGYVRYSEDLFSVDVHLTKFMLIGKTKRPQYDTTSDTLFFIRNTGEGEPWLLVDMMSNLDNN